MEQRADLPARWGIGPPVFAALFGAALLATAWAILAGSRVDRLVAICVVIAAVAAGLACLTMRNRLTADRSGLTLRGPGGTRTIAWSTIASIEVIQRSRLGLGSTTLEVDLDDNGLIVLGRFDLGADPDVVARRLHALRP